MMKLSKNIQFIFILILSFLFFIAGCAQAIPKASVSPEVIATPTPTAQITPAPIDVESITTDFISNLATLNYTGAKTLYEGYKENPQLMTRFQNAVTAAAADMFSKYMTETITAQEYKDVILGLKTIYENDDLSSAYLEKVDVIEKSKTSYRSGIEAYSKQLYEDALISFGEVVEVDKYYADAQAKIIECTIPYKTSVISKVAVLIKGNDYSEALSELNSALSLLKDDSELTALQKLVVEKQDDYKVAHKKALLSKTTSIFDDMVGKTIYVPKGYSTRYVNVNESINIEPSIQEIDDVAVLIIRYGFEQEGWVFFDKVTVNCDGTIESFEVGFSERQTQVVGGGTIAEWTTKVVFPLGTDDGTLALIERISTAKSAKIRFSGTGYRDHVVTKTEKANLATFIELYNEFNKTLLSIE